MSTLQGPDIGLTDEQYSHLVLYFYDPLLHKNMKFTLCLNQVCQVCGTNIKFLYRFCAMEVLKSLNRRPATYEKCSQVTDFLARRHLSNLILSNSVFAYILHTKCYNLTTLT